MEQDDTLGRFIVSACDKENLMKDLGPKPPIRTIDSGIHRGVEFGFVPISCEMHNRRECLYMQRRRQRSPPYYLSIIIEPIRRSGLRAHGEVGEKLNADETPDQR